MCLACDSCASPFHIVKERNGVVSSMAAWQKLVEEVGFTAGLFGPDRFFHRIPARTAISQSSPHLLRYDRTPRQGLLHRAQCGIGKLLDSVLSSPEPNLS